jgi:hypothetical protein
MFVDELVTFVARLYVVIDPKYSRVSGRHIEYRIAAREGEDGPLAGAGLERHPNVMAYGTGITAESDNRAAGAQRRLRVVPRDEPDKPDDARPIWCHARLKGGAKPFRSRGPAHRV